MRGDRLFIEAVLYRAKTGMPWRDLPERFGPWKSVYNPVLQLGEEGALGDDLQGAAIGGRRDRLDR
jgi:transposase